MLKYIIAVCLSVGGFFAMAQSINYNLEMPKPQNHYYHVEMEINDFAEKELIVKMPIWAPGSYLAREFAKNVNLVKAFDGKGNELEVKKINKNSWKIFKGNAQKVSVKYEVYAFELSVRTSFLDLSHGFVSGSGVFMYVDELKDKPGTVTVFPHKDFKVITTALKESGEDAVGDGGTQYDFTNYDHLVDCPFEIGNQEVFYFDAAGVRHKVAMYSFGNYDIPTLKRDMAKVVEAATGVFGQNPNKDYTFIIHNVVDAQGGLEHVNSTVLSVNRWTYSGDDYVGFLKLVAHEYFHLWNVKRIRPIELGPFNYDEENYTSLLWVMEGFTSYYEKMILLRAGFYTKKQLLSSMFSSLNYVEGSVGSRVQPVAHASFDAWIKAYRPNENSSNTTMSYYSRGSVIAMMLDAKIIKKYKGKKGLDDFMQHIYKTYYEKLNRGFSEDEFKNELSKFLGENMDDFYAKYINGTEIPDYDAVFSPLGVSVKYVGVSKPDIGISMKDSGGKTIVTRIRSNSAAEDAGISVNDELIGCNGIRADKHSLEAYFENLSSGELMEILYARDDQLYSTELIVTEYESPKFKYIINPTAKNADLHKYWLRRGTE
ncbi:MAG: PDZ domain-containing protein [Crocinitomicaceae bacterium]|nr:PDZ domain-containing protein [Crocinitomicaceae bacterium]